MKGFGNEDYNILISLRICIGFTYNEQLCSRENIVRWFHKPGVWISKYNFNNIQRTYTNLLSTLFQRRHEAFLFIRKRYIGKSQYICSLKVIKRSTMSTFRQEASSAVQLHLGHLVDLQRSVFYHMQYSPCNQAENRNRSCPRFQKMQEILFPYFRCFHLMNPHHQNPWEIRIGNFRNL